MPRTIISYLDSVKRIEAYAATERFLSNHPPRGGRGLLAGEHCGTFLVPAATQ